MAGFDLSILPDLVLEKIFKMLPVPDRGHLASCNSRLVGFMDTPKLWRKVSLDLETVLVLCESKGGPVFVDRIHDCYLVMLEKYGQHFQRVSVNMRSGMIENQTLALLTELCERNVIQSVSLRLDGLLSKAVNLLAEGSLMGRSFICNIAFNNTVISPFEPQPGLLHSPASDLIDSLKSDTDFTIALPPHSHNIKEFFEQGFHLYPDIYYCAAFCYCFNMSKECHSLLKKLMLSPLPVPEEAIAPEWCQLREGEKQTPSLTVQLISRLPNLQELHVNIAHLSDVLLLELSRTSVIRKPLRSLVIRHIVCDCEVDSMSDTYMELSLSLWNKGTFPQLSSAAWDQLAQSSPSLTVECSVVSDKLPLLKDVIKAETPLVRLEVLCRTTSSGDQSVPVLQELSENHSRLTVVGVRFRGCKCTSADS